MMNFLRTNPIASAILTFIRLYLGYEWFMGGLGKIKEGGFDASGFLQGAMAKSTGDHPAVQGWWASFLEHVALPNVEIFNFLVPWGEFLVGVALLLGVLTTFAITMGLTMNFAFLLSGTTSTNPQMVILSMFILVAGYNAGKFGLDRWVIPFLHKHVWKKHQTQEGIEE